MGMCGYVCCEWVGLWYVSVWSVEKGLLLQPKSFAAERGQFCLAPKGEELGAAPGANPALLPELPLPTLRLRPPLRLVLGAALLGRQQSVGKLVPILASGGINFVKCL